MKNAKSARFKPHGSFRTIVRDYPTIDLSDYVLSTMDENTIEHTIKTAEALYKEISKQIELLGGYAEERRNRHFGQVA